MLEILIQKLINNGRIGATEEYSTEYLSGAFLDAGLPVEINGDELILREVDSPFDKGIIESHLLNLGEAIPHTLEIHQVIDSTNDYLKQIAKEHELPFIVLAEYQTKGHGRRGNRWVSSYGEDICCSVAWQVNYGYMVTGVESLIIALALAETLEQIGLNGVEVKWPNDIYVYGKKIAGILIEQIFSGEQAILIVGIGLNLKRRIQEGESDQFMGTSIGNEIGDYDRNLVVAMLIEDQLRALSELIPHLNEELMLKWSGRDFLRGKEISIEQDGLIKGRYMGIDKQGRLLLETKEQFFKITSGHITEISL
ncbi:MAG: biotin--[acetyl-CoA-carboxylase] ligase [Gammaproteobacteria bacterium]|nr:biotin--[acetyl-CoA-carboxylase] ligase [Gammaproteobacteria bacterium]